MPLRSGYDRSQIRDALGTSVIAILWPINFLQFSDIGIEEIGQELFSRSRKYRMTVAGQMIKHLGLPMYSGAVPALAELISNAYDAMAKNVNITIPIGKPLEAADKIVAEDDGHGMTYEGCNDLYRTVGRDRRAAGTYGA